MTNAKKSELFRTWQAQKCLIKDLEHKLGLIELDLFYAKEEERQLNKEWRSIETN